MGYRAFSSLLVAALLIISLLTHHLPVSCARHVAVLKVDDGFNNRGDTNLGKEPASASAGDVVAKKEFKGRKLGARNIEEAKAIGVNGDRKETADTSNPKPQGSQKKQQGLAGSSAEAARHRRPAGSATSAGAGSRPRTVEMRAAGKHADPATEMYDMLRRDYAAKAKRRRPINNGVPMQDEEP
ncbi:hypothetical protein QOZ80_4AG0314250 [Eleusine coracana subsp. coracana]|nr:hypothetical protein QOZ80_4AG0314250 [Eleusine coracana subsp. coracana]